MMDSRTIRSMKRRDWPQVLALGVEAFPRLPRKELAYQLRVHWRCARVAVGSSGRVVGFWLCDLGHAPKMAWLEYIAVAKSARGERLGLALLSSFESWAAQAGFVRAGLAVDRDNSEACKLYEARGWERRDTGDIKRWGYEKKLSELPSQSNLRAPSRLVALYDRLWFEILTRLFQS